MKIILFGLLQAFSGWLVAGTLIAWYLQSHGMRLSDTIGIAIFGGLFAWASFGLFVSSYGRWRERAAILGGIAGTPPVDGKHGVLVGTIEVTGPRLQAPLDGSPCVMYTYLIENDTGSGKSRALSTIARGVALTPSRIVTRSGSYKLLVLPDCDVAANDAVKACFHRTRERRTLWSRPDLYRSRTLCSVAAERQIDMAPDFTEYKMP